MPPSIPTNPSLVRRILGQLRLAGFARLWQRLGPRRLLASLDKLF